MKDLRQSLSKLKENVIGIVKTGENSHELIVNFQETNQTIDTIKITNFAVLQTNYNMPIRFGKVYLFENNMTMDEVLKDPHKWAEICKSLN